MKKSLAVLAVLAVAAVAQAELLASWDLEGSGITVSPSTTAANYDKVTFHDFTRMGSMTNPNTTSSGHAQAGNWAAGNYLQSDIEVEDSWQITGVKMSVDGINGTSTGPATLQWLVGSSVDSATKGGVWSNTTTRNGAAPAEGAASLPTISGNTHIFVTGNEGGQIGDSTKSPTGNARFYGTLSMDGTIGQAVPEPATMSLLGLGALAMALRRKLRK